MKPEIDLDHLDALHAAAIEGVEYELTADADLVHHGSRSFALGEGPGRNQRVARAACIAALHNAYPALSARLRAAEAVVEAARNVRMVAVNRGEVDWVRGAEMDDLDAALRRYEEAGK